MRFSYRFWEWSKKVKEDDICWIPSKNIQTKDKYIASDGEEFDFKFEALDYEKQILIRKLCGREGESFDRLVSNMISKKNDVIMILQDKGE